MSTAPSVNGDLTINNNLIKTTIKPKKIDVVDGLSAPEDNEEIQADNNDGLIINNPLKTSVETAVEDKEVVEITDETEPETVENSIQEENLDVNNRIFYYESSRGCPFRCSYCLSSIDKRNYMVYNKFNISRKGIPLSCCLNRSII